MKFKEWLKINETKAYVGNSPVSRNYSFRNRGYEPSNVLVSSNPDHPSLLGKAVTNLAQGTGESFADTLEKTGLKVRSIGNIRNFPMGEPSAPGVKYYSLPLQIPVLKHNNSDQKYPIPLESGSRITQKGAYKEAMSIPADRIRHIKDGQEVEVNGKFLLLHKENDNEDSWNYNPNESVQFTRALIYKCIVDQINQKEYNINSFEVSGENEQNGILTTWFTFESNRFAEKK